jgi:flavodoxin
MSVLGKKLVVYYSRTGFTKTVADKIAADLGADIEAVCDKDDRSGMIGYLKAGRDASLKRLAAITPPIYDPSGYDLVIIGTPVWAFTLSAPIRSYITSNKGRFKMVAFFCTQGGSGADGAFLEMERLCNIKPTAIIALLAKDVSNGSFIRSLDGFKTALAR